MAILTVALAAAVGVLYLKYAIYPVLDREVSVRAFWRENQSRLDGVCMSDLARASEYGLNYYTGHKLQDCAVANAPRVSGKGGRLQLSVK